MAPQRPRTVISFEDKLFPDAAPGHKAILTIFEHVEGARVGPDLSNHVMIQPSYCVKEVFC